MQLFLFVYLFCWNEINIIETSITYKLDNVSKKENNILKKKKMVLLYSIQAKAKIT